MAVQQVSAVYTLLSPNGYRAVFNNAADADYVGDLLGEEGITGLDSPDLRTSMYDKVQADGAIFGEFFHGTRPITMQGMILASTVTARNARTAKLDKAVNDCARGAGTLTWTPTGGVSSFVTVRKHQPQRVKGGWAKNFMVSLVAADPLVYASTLSTLTDTSASVTVSPNNTGDAPSPPALIRITGPVTNPAVRRVQGAYDHRLRLQGLTIATGQYVDISVVNATAIRSDGTDVYQYIDFPTAAAWWTVLPGVNTVTLEGTGRTTGTTAIRVDWRSAWL
jgi:hypothetical protein